MRACMSAWEVQVWQWPGGHSCFWTSGMITGEGFEIG